ncbi:uncharacterized protein LOC108889339 [Lates calcarifer]|uniref:Uncharacterized protein LOC108889339 n=2 Tax=Lates calcarifer TaxID=8187 RepID=A0AAJ8BCM5_LATCA|nr:uncharacterized protein LOC108889339 [Lates calcarifer]
MDDLDHSMHIAEFDWTSFYDESEECRLLQPSLACPDNLSLSDSEDPENSSPVFNKGQNEIQQSPDVSGDGAESNAPGCSTGEENSVKLSMKLQQQWRTSWRRKGLQKTSQGRQQCMFSVQEHLQSLEKVNRDLQMETDHSRNEPDPLSLNQTEANENEPNAADGATSEDTSGVSPRAAEKERWFVTVNDSPARQRVRATSVKKKRRQKKPCRNGHVCIPGQEESPENGLELQINMDKNESEGGRDMGGFTQSIQKLMVQNSGGLQSAEINPESISHSLQMSCEEDSLSEKLVISHPPIENITEPITDRNKHETGSSASTSHDTFTPKDPSQLESAESDEFEDGVEFFPSYDSESYLSAAESVEDTQHFLIEKLQPVDLIQLQHSGSPTSQTERDFTQDRKMLPCDSVLSCNAAATDCDGYERADVDPTLTFPSAGQRANKMPDDNPACDDNTQHSTVLHTLSDTPGFQNDTINLSASGSSSGDRLNPPPVPDLTVTPCPVADSPETYAEAAGHTRPVYAISAFWDEMEKLTINDILQLRMGKSTPPRDTQETAMANEDESLTSQNSLVDTVQYSSSDSGLMDASDTADSDYFTQPDESKPDRSSCEFSTSDFEEEYWQFLGASRNPSPDPQSKNQRTDDYPFLSPEEWSSTSSEGKETPVPLEDFEGQWFENRESRTLSELAWPRRIAKSKSMHNVQALNTDDLTLPFGDDESSLFLSSCQSLEDNVVLKVSDSLGTLIPAPFLSNTDILDEHYQISFPEVFEYFFADDKTKTDSRCVAVYDPEDISVAPMFGYTLCTFRDELPFSSLHDSQCSEEKPIPIFSCSHPTIRELTFPKSDYVFLSADCKMAAEDVDDFSPIRVVSRSFIQANQHGTSAAAAGGSRSWKSLLSMRKICFHNKGSIWCRRSGAWVFPVKYERTERKHPPIAALTEGKGSSTPSQLLTVQQSILATIQPTKREGIFSTLKQSDMCLVCIAFASWVLKSSDPEAADAWKAALLANVSALSAIQYLRQYVKKRSPQDDP